MRPQRSTSQLPALVALALAWLAVCHGGRSRHARLRARTAVPSLGVGPGNNVLVQAQIEASLASVGLRRVLSGGDENAQQKTMRTSQSGQPVKLQVAQEDIDAFVSRLSSGCGTRFSEMLEGKGPPIHTFTGDAGKADCKELHGELCATVARVLEARETPGGRQMTSTVDVKGSSCLPKECMAKADLGELSNFMLTRVGEAMPGSGANVELHVDCGLSGGGKMVVNKKPGTPSKQEAIKSQEPTKV